MSEKAINSDFRKQYSFTLQKPLAVIVVIGLFIPLVSKMTAQTTEEYKVTKEKIRELIIQLGDEKDSVRRDAAWSLGKLCESKTAYPLIREAVQPLLQAIVDENPQVRTYAVSTLGKIGDSQALYPLINALKDNDSNVRLMASVALGKIGDPQAIKSLNEALKDEDERVRKSATQALRIIKSIQQMNPNALPGERRIRLPNDESIGNLKIRDWSSSDPNAWKSHSDARGIVVIPRGKELRLDFSPNYSGEFSLLASLGSSDLQSLNLQGTKITDKELINLKNLTFLRELYLQGTQVSDAGIAYLKNLTSLRVLNLEKTKVSNKGLAYLKKFKSLEVVRLGNTDISDEGISQLKDLKSLTVLFIGNTNVTDNSLAYVENLPRIKRLCLHDTRITDTGLIHLKELKGLEYLCLHDTQITNIGLVYLRGLTSLKTLNLHNTQIGDPGLNYLRNLIALEKLSLQRTRVTQIGANKLKQALSKCEISGAPFPSSRQYAHQPSRQKSRTSKAIPTISSSRRIPVSTNTLSDTFQWKHINIDIKIQENGDLLVSEEQKYSFKKGNNEKWHARYRWFPMIELDDIRDVQVFEIARNDNVLSVPLMLTHKVQRKQGQFWIWWWHELNPPETHTFLLKYRVIGGIRVLKSTDELCWKAIAKNKSTQVEKAKVNIQLPPSLCGKCSARVGNGAPATLKISQDGSKVEFNTSAPLIPRNVGLEVRVSFPHDILKLKKPKWQGLWARTRTLSRGQTRTRRGRQSDKDWMLWLFFVLAIIFIFGKLVKSLVTGDWSNWDRGGGWGGCGGGGCGGGGCGGGGCGGGG